MIRPVAVVISASETPAATTAGVELPFSAMSWKARMMPKTVPKRPDEGRDDGDGADNREVALERVQMLHQRDRERVGDVGAVLLTAAKPELEDPRQHPAVLPTDLDSALEIVARNLGADLTQQTFRIAVLHLKEDEPLDDDCKTDN